MYRPNARGPILTGPSFNRPVVLATDDVRVFTDAPAGFDAPSTGKIEGCVEVFEYDSTVTGVKRKAVAHNPIIWADVPDIAMIRVGKTYKQQMHYSQPARRAA